MSNKSKGDFGEKLAAGFLEKCGFTILSVNFRSRRAEIDIVAQKDKLIVFAEVKLRRDTSCGYPREAVTAAKQGRIRQAAEYYIYTNGLEDMEFRFDVVEILGSGMGYEVEHIENAFF